VQKKSNSFKSLLSFLFKLAKFDVSRLYLFPDFKMLASVLENALNGQMLPNLWETVFWFGLFWQLRPSVLETMCFW